MRVGTPGFQGQRLREAREARGLLAVPLANLLGVSKQLINDYERGDKSPSPERMRRIADLLRFPVHFFTSKWPEELESPVFYRSLATTSEASRGMARWQMKSAMRLSDLLRAYIQMVPVKLPPFNPPSDPAQIQMGHIEELAIKLRRYWELGDGPIGNVIWLLENNGAIVLRREFGDECLDAFSVWRASEGRPFIALSTDKRSAVRSRFDAAHELGHMILHRNVPESVFEDREVFKLIERQAHRFAGAFLLPASAFAAECYIPSLDLFRSMKSKWRVAIAAMVHRAHDLEMIDDDQLRRFHINLARRKWKTREPLDETLEPESPRFMGRAIDSVFEAGLMSKQDMEVRLAVGPSEIEATCGLGPGAIDETSSPFKFPVIADREQPRGPRFDDTPPLPFRLE